MGHFSVEISRTPGSVLSGNQHAFLYSCAPIGTSPTSSRLRLTEARSPEVQLDSPKQGNGKMIWYRRFGRRQDGYGGMISLELSSKGPTG